MALFGGCGGAGGNDHGASNTALQTAPTSPLTASLTVTDPLTGAAAPGNATTTLRGMAYAGASVTAYNVQPDGSSGSAIAGPVTATIDGFTLTFATAPTAWVRLVATGGTRTRAADNTVQPGGTMQLVTPFVTTALNDLNITPLTDIAANVMASKARKGAALPAAFAAGMQNLLALDVANVVFLSDTTVYLNVLRGAIKSDNMYYGAQSLHSTELLSGLDFLGVALDLPTMEIARVVGASAQSDYLPTGVDGAGAAINAGKWIGNSFDPAAVQTLIALMNAKVPDDQKVMDSRTGTNVAPRVSDYMSKYMVMDFTIDAACRSHASGFMTSRYPFYELDSQGGMRAADCSAAARRLADLNARLATNISTGMK